MHQTQGKENRKESPLWTVKISPTYINKYFQNTVFGNKVYISYSGKSFSWIHHFTFSSLYHNKLDNIRFKLKCNRQSINKHHSLGHIGLALFYNPGWIRFLFIIGVKMNSVGPLPVSCLCPFFRLSHPVLLRASPHVFCDTRDQLEGSSMLYKLLRTLVGTGSHCRSIECTCDIKMNCALKSIGCQVIRFALRKGGLRRGQRAKGKFQTGGKLAS